ncbi:hypothetical protein [Leptolyngbya sp. NIES-2104]|uniref:hypothetical protein n=1 Tax=Leptolyngbya sp. NIES-2104 TaxID=1552121 RepID=UPI0006ECBCD2|nr:hypothetical protein [Leptolyngbya sp. NIES-2104]GAP97971.1 hypothetical protein NIES2104_45240 [Leptolyngbya sp. NIES-2104]
MLDPTKPISACTAQEIAIAQLIDASSGRFDATQVLRDLEARRSLWRAFLMGRPFLHCDEAGLPACGLLPLRDLERHWNLDMLYILAQSEASVAPLLHVADAWGCEAGQYSLAQAERLLGTGRPAPIVWAWWD